MKQCITCKRFVVNQYGDAFDSNFCWWHTASSPKPTLICIAGIIFICLMLINS